MSQTLGNAQELSRASQRAFNELQNVALTVRTPNTARDLWDTVFSPEERARLGNDLDEAYSTGGAIRMWTALHGCSDLRAVVEIAFSLRHLSPSERRWLLRE